jgi:hypothetical protein
MGENQVGSISEQTIKGMMSEQLNLAIARETL